MVKTMRKFLSLLVVVLLLFLVGCAKNMDLSESASPKSDYSRDESYSGKEYYDIGDSAAPSGAEGEAYYVIPGEGETDKETSEEKENEMQLRAGLLTASCTMDNEKYAFWKSLLISNQEGEGIFQKYNRDFSFKTGARIKLTFPKGAYAEVTLVKDGKDSFTGVTDANGICYIFSDKEEENYELKINYLGKDGSLVSMNDTVTGDKEYDFEALTSESELIELMFVIDATGSMGDEMEYLKLEIADVIKKVKEMNGNVRILLSLMVYRDKGDEYVTRYDDFKEDIDSSLVFLGKQRASGGGDFEEAVQVALSEANDKQWATTKATKILVHVADAPSHDSDVESWANTTKALAAKGIHVITIASSGIDKKTEYFFRCQSLLTNGAYVHITSDSGIGGDHIEATVEEKEEVELLNDLLVRLINGFHTGDFGTPVNWRQSQTSPLS